MIDIHSHLLYDLDDGPSAREGTIRMLEKAAGLGVKAIIATPHYHDDLFNYEKLHDIFAEVSKLAESYGIDLSLGYEIFFTPESVSSRRDHLSLTLNQSKYLLIEFPYSRFPLGSFKWLSRIHSEGLIPIIAHPERCRDFNKGMAMFDHLLEIGCMIQLDSASICGVYGLHIKAFSRKVIKLHKAHFIASNAHFAEDYTDYYGKAYQKVLNWVGKEYADDLFSNNAKVLIDENSGVIKYG